MVNQYSDIIKKIFNSEIISCEKIGGGLAGGVVYKLTLDKEPYNVAIKTAKNYSLLKEECNCINFIRSFVDIKLPKIYYVSDNLNEIYAIMEYFDGKNCADAFLLKAPKKIRLEVATQIADNIIKLQNVKGEKYGDIFEPKYGGWHDYYHPFVKMVIDEGEALLKNGLLNKKILNALKLGNKYYDKIFEEPISKPTLTHGDYWAPNIIIDANYKLIGVVDPFNCMWADSEYELFAFNAIYGNKLPILEAFLKKVDVSKNFYLKNAFYILVSETFWIVKLMHNNKKYLNFLTRNFIKQLKLFNIPLK